MALSRKQEKIVDKALTKSYAWTIEKSPSGISHEYQAVRITIMGDRVIERKVIRVPDVRGHVDAYVRYDMDEVLRGNTGE